MTSDRVRHRGEIMAETKEDAYSRLRTQKIRPIRGLAEGEAEPPPKIFAKKGEKKHKPHRIALPAALIDYSTEEINGTGGRRQIAGCNVPNRIVWQNNWGGITGGGTLKRVIISLVNRVVL